MRAIKFLPLVAALMFFFAAAGCGAKDDDADDDAGSVPTDDDTTDDDSTPGVDDDGVDDDSAPPCDDNLRPIVFVHGMLEEGDAFAAQTMRYGSNGYCLDRIYAYDYNTMLAPLSESVANLETFVDQVLAETGATQIDLLGHSMGGAVGQKYLQKAANAAKVAHYANLASFSIDGGVPNDVPAINISSTADHIAGPSEIEGAQNVTFDDLDHLQVATSAESFDAFFTFFSDGVAPETTEIVPDEPLVLSGRVVAFAVNDPSPDHHLQIYEVDGETGERLTEEPLAEFVTDAGGYWGDFTAAPGAFYEFVALDPNGDWPPVHYYREPFPRANNKVYFRAFPPPISLLGFAFRLLPYNDDYAIFAWLNINQAFVYGRDTMTVDGIDITTPDMADPAATTIAIFFFDTNFNGISDQQPSGGLYNKFIFMRFFDLLIPSSPARGIPFVFNGRPVTICN